MLASPKEFLYGGRDIFLIGVVSLPLPVLFTVQSGWCILLSMGNLTRYIPSSWYSHFEPCAEIHSAKYSSYSF